MPKMSLRDGTLKRKDLYITSDTSFAAYLMLRGYELLGTFDEGQIGPNGKPRLFFGLMTVNSSLLDARHALQAVDTDIQSKYDEFENMWLSIPHDPTAKINVKQFYLNTRACFRALDEAIRKP